MALRDDGNHPTLLPLMLGGGSAAERCAPRGSASITARADRAWSVRPGDLRRGQQGLESLRQISFRSYRYKFARIVGEHNTT